MLDSSAHALGAVGAGGILTTNPLFVVSSGAGSASDCF